MEAIKSVKFGTDAGVTLVNPASFIRKCETDDVGCKSYDNRDKAWFRDAVYPTTGLDIVFWIDKSEKMREGYQSYGVFMQKWRYDRMRDTVVHSTHISFTSIFA